MYKQWCLYRQFGRIRTIAHTHTLCAMQREPTRIRAHLVFADTWANAEKTKSLSRIYFGKLFFANARWKNIEIEE